MEYGFIGLGVKGPVESFKRIQIAFYQTVYKRICPIGTLSYAAQKCTDLSHEETKWVFFILGRGRFIAHDTGYYIHNDFHVENLQGVVDNITPKHHFRDILNLSFWMQLDHQ